jgi:penicillin-binding protein-related factor A (putative recombinase)
MEVKSRKAGRVVLSSVGEAQALDLTRMSYWGHLALVLVRLVDEWYLVDYRAWTHVKKRSLNAHDLEVQGARVPLSAHGLPDYLSVVDTAITNADAYLARLDQETHDSD